MKTKSIDRNFRPRSVARATRPSRPSSKSETVLEFQFIFEEVAHVSSFQRRFYILEQQKKPVSYPFTSLSDQRELSHKFGIGLGDTEIQWLGSSDNNLLIHSPFLLDR